MIDLNLHDYQNRLQLKKEAEQVMVFGIIRKKYLILQPEEMVRQLLIHYLIDYGYPKEKIQVERGLEVNGQYRRFDIIVYDKAFAPYLLVECKAHTVRIDQKAFDQMALYNISVKAPYLMTCNGVQTYCCALDFAAKQFTHLTSIPKYGKK